jgi:hypothetical protein
MLIDGYIFENEIFKQKISISMNNDIEAIGVNNWIYTNVVLNLELFHLKGIEKTFLRLCDMHSIL